MAGLLESFNSLPSGAQAGAISAAGNLVGSGLSFLAQRSLNRQSLGLSKELYDYQTDYSNIMQKMIKAGISPAAAAQGVSGSPGSSVSMSGGSAPDLSQLGSNAMRDSLVPSEQQKNESDAEKASADAEKIRVETSWLPPQYQAMFDEISSRIRKNNSEIRLNHSLASMYDESVADLRLLRPWKLAQAKQTFLNLGQEYNEIQSRINVNRALSGLYKTQSGYYGNLSKQVVKENYRLDFENGARRCGFDPNKGVWDNLGRMSITNPRQFRGWLGAFNSTINAVDDECQFLFGKHYKRNAGLIGAGLFIRNEMDRGFDKLNTLGRTVSGFIPFTNPASSSSRRKSLHK